LSQFLLKKGSSGSLHTFENNEYSYKINLDSINTATGNTVSKNHSRQGGNDTHGANNQNGNGSALGMQQNNGMMINENNHTGGEMINMWD
jgi:hypothetical protein